MNLVAALLYWIAVAVWLTVLATVVINYLRNPRGFGSARLLLIVVVIDTTRNLVENIYFGSYWGGQFGLFDPDVVGFLGSPSLMMVPKALNIVAGSVVLGLLILRWLPQTLRERAEAAQRLTAVEREANAFAVVMDRMSMPILVLDAQHPDRHVVFANRAYLTGWNHTPADIIGRTWTYQEAVDPKGPEVAELHAAIICTRYGMVTVPCRRPDGSTYLGRVSVTPITDATGRITLLTVMCEGIIEPNAPPGALAAYSAHDTTSDAAPAAAVETSPAATSAADTRERLVGKLAGSVAHDFNNLLSVMLSSLEDARDFLTPNSPATKAVDLTVRAAKRSSELASRLMEYSRNRAVHVGEGQSGQVDVNQLIENLRPLLARAVTSAVRLELDLPVAPVMCKLDAGRLEDALMNLCLNARDAITGDGGPEDGGKVRIAVRAEGAQRKEVAGKTTAVITVADTGIGMTPAVLARATQRHFTTKPEGRGNGLGLSSVQEFVEAAGGTLTLESEPGHGTTIYLRVPVNS